VMYVALSRLIIQIALMVLLTAARWPLMQTWISQHPMIAAIIVLGVFIVTVTAFRWSSARRPKPNTHDTTRQVIILQVGGGPMTNRVPPVTKTVTSINSIS
jgi:hypothetical protein